jgi:hypothetical protein
MIDEVKGVADFLKVPHFFRDILHFVNGSFLISILYVFEIIPAYRLKILLSLPMAIQVVFWVSFIYLVGRVLNETAVVIITFCRFIIDFFKSKSKWSYLKKSLNLFPTPNEYINTDPHIICDCDIEEVIQNISNLKNERERNAYGQIVIRALFVDSIIFCYIFSWYFIFPFVILLYQDYDTFMDNHRMRAEVAKYVNNKKIEEKK